jgi:hypothetical protein
VKCRGVDVLHPAGSRLRDQFVGIGRRLRFVAVRRRILIEHDDVVVGYLLAGMLVELPVALPLSAALLRAERHEHESCRAHDGQRHPATIHVHPDLLGCQPPVTGDRRLASRRSNEAGIVFPP